MPELSSNMIQELLAPVVLISACGLLCVAMYNRLASIVARIRQFHHERVEVLTKLEHGDPERACTLHNRFEGLGHQAQHMLCRARFVRAALIQLISTVMLMLTCSLSIGLTPLSHVMQTVAVALFVAGVMSMLVAMAFTIRELTLSLKDVTYEHERIGALMTPLLGLVSLVSICWG